jgi:adenylylsulfate kinase-like enzyme|tara:strand:+ start:1050 stop:1520 length:471 start_codon:yes stop_codon:yes gene_type:complete
MIYWFTGQPSSGKTTLGSKLHKFLETEKRNWRKSVFHIDGDDLRKLTVNKDYSDKGRESNIRLAQTMAEYIHNNECDVVVSLVSPYRNLREEFKTKMKDEIVEIYLHTTERRERYKYRARDYEKPEIKFIDVDTTKDSADTSFSKIINHLNKLEKL